jgi:hypothetical protein
MKKNILFLMLLGNICLAQITISGSSNPAINQVFGPTPSTNVVMGTYCGIPASYDLGTNLYAVNDPNYATTPITYWIIRRGGYWYIEGAWSAGPYYIYYKSASPSTDPNPPCNTTWVTYSGYCYNSGSIVVTGTTSTLLLSGTCVSSPVSASTITPTYINLPHQSTAQINAIASPQKGMMVFDATANVVKVFNGAVWSVLKTL